jgi:hypothetical protein
VKASWIPLIKATTAGSSTRVERNSRKGIRSSASDMTHQSIQVKLSSRKACPRPPTCLVCVKYAIRTDKYPLFNQTIGSVDDVEFEGYEFQALWVMNVNERLMETLSSCLHEKMLRPRLRCATSMDYEAGGAPHRKDISVFPLRFGTIVFTEASVVRQTKRQERR